MSDRVKLIIYRVVQAVVLFLLIRFLISLKWDIVLRYVPQLLEAIWLTLQLTFLSLLFGFIIALPSALVRVQNSPKWLARFLDGYVAVFRGTPLLVQLFLIYYGTGQFEFIRESFLWPVFKSAYSCAIIAFSLNAGAYACEIFRGALANTPKGQLEAARALGFKPWQVNWLIWIPSALRRSLPQYGNEMIFMMHGTALAGLVSLSEVFGMSREINARHYFAYEGLLTAAIIYVILTIILSGLSKSLEKKYLSYQK